MTSGRQAFQQHVKRAEGSDTPLASHTRKGPERRMYKFQFWQKQKDHAAQRGRDAFGSTPGQDPKAAKYAVLIPGPGMFVNMQYVSGVVIMELPAAKSGSGEFRV